MAISELTLNLSVKRRFWFTPALFGGVAICRLLRRETFPDRLIGFIVKYGMKVEIKEC